jgi:hypothetical protein
MASIKTECVRNDDDYDGGGGDDNDDGCCGIKEIRYSQLCSPVSAFSPLDENETNMQSGTNTPPCYHEVVSGAAMGD